MFASFFEILRRQITVPRRYAQVLRVDAGRRQGHLAKPARAVTPLALRFLTPAGLPSLFDFPPDMARVPTEVNRLSNQVLVQTFEEEWGKVQR